MLTEDILRLAISRGLTTADFNEMTIGMVIDYLVNCQNAEIDAKNNTKRATQKDIDAF